MVAEIKKLYYSIGEVGKMTGLQQYVLRYWETEFSNLRPGKNRAGNRIYREKDIEIIKDIQNLLYKKKYTIEGARQHFRKSSDGDQQATGKNGFTRSQFDIKILKELKSELGELLKVIRSYKE